MSALGDTDQVLRLSILEWLIMICKANCHYICIYIGVKTHSSFFQHRIRWHWAAIENWVTSQGWLMMERFDPKHTLAPEHPNQELIAQWPASTWLTSQGSAGRKSLRGPIGRRSARVSSRSCSGSAKWIQISDDHCKALHPIHPNNLILRRTPMGYSSRVLTVL